MICSRMWSGVSGVLAALLVVTVAGTAVGAPSGPPIRIGGTLALTGPRAATALLHKITGEIYVEELR
jgi:branched-chain amino acid transport system substrate-binding protein